MESNQIHDLMNSFENYKAIKSFLSFIGNLKISRDSRLTSIIDLNFDINTCDKYAYTCIKTFIPFFINQFDNLDQINELLDEWDAKKFQSALEKLNDFNIKSLSVHIIDDICNWYSDENNKVIGFQKSFIYKNLSLMFPILKIEDESPNNSGDNMLNSYKDFLETYLKNRFKVKKPSRRNLIHRLKGIDSKYNDSLNNS